MAESYLFERRFPSGYVGTLGHAINYGKGWKFYPQVAGRHASRKFHSTMEACLPKWIGYPDRCVVRRA